MNIKKKKRKKKEHYYYYHVPSFQGRKHYCQRYECDSILSVDYSSEISHLHFATYVAVQKIWNSGAGVSA